MESDLPEQGEPHYPTIHLIQCAYPHGIPDAHYMTLLNILIQDMSIRVLSRVVSFIRGGHYAIYMHDTIRAISYEPEHHIYSLMKEKLADCGYEE